MDPDGAPRLVAALPLPQVLVTACDRLSQVAFALGRLQMDAGLDVIPSEYMRTQLNYGRECAAPGARPPSNPGCTSLFTRRSSLADVRVGCWSTLRRDLQPH